MSLFGNLLRSIKIVRAEFHVVDLHGDSGYSLHDERRSTIHLVFDRRLTIEMRLDRFSLDLDKGQYAFSPPGVTAQVGAPDGRKIEALALPDDAQGDRLHRLRIGTGPLRAQMLLALLDVDRVRMDAVTHYVPGIREQLSYSGPSVYAVPPLLSVDGLRESSQVVAGPALLQGVAEILYVNAVRDRVLDGDAAMLEVHRSASAAIARATQLVYRNPEKEWTVTSLAGEAGMSRSAFSAAFSRSIGLPPMDFVTHVRMMRAEALMRDSSHRLAQVAAFCGYSSETAFNRAFRRYSGTSPGVWRRSLVQS